MNTETTDAAPSEISKAKALLRRLPARKRVARLAQEEGPEADALFTVAAGERQRFTAEEWQAVLAGLDSSPLTVAEWLSAQGATS